MQKFFFFAMSLGMLGCSSVPVDPAERDRANIREVFKSHETEVRQCYLKPQGSVLPTSTLPSGTLKAKVRIAKEGKLLDSSVVDSTLQAPDTERCIGDALKKFTFKPLEFGQTVTVEWPYNFRKNL